MEHMQKKSSESLLGAIKGSEDVRVLSHDQLGELCQELRHFLIDTVSRVGGHFGSNLGRPTIQTRDSGALAQLVEQRTLNP